jgi:MFS family permease
VSTLVVSISIGGIGLVEHVGYIFPLLIVTGVAVGVINVAMTTLMTIRTPESKRGRMFASVGAIFTSAQIGGTAIGGLILTIVAPRTVFQIAGIATTVVLLIMGPFGYRASRRASQLEGDPQGD